MTHPATFELPTADDRTGLLNMAYFRHVLREQLLPEAKASDEPLAVFLLDLDGFHELNQRHGREAGDQVLQRVVEALQATMAETATLARYGGDEFAGALPDTRLDDAFTLLEELRRRIAGLTLDGQREAAITCSVGLAAFPGNGQGDVEVMREADQALYVAKSTGRNKVSLPLADSRMVTKTSHYTATQLERLAQLAKTLRRNEASVLREALDDVLKKYNDRLSPPPTA